MTFISNARMYAVTPEAEDAWKSLLENISNDASVPLSYQPYAAPQPLETLWRRQDIGCVQMCGYPIALGVADTIPIAAPVPAASWAKGRAVYRSDLIVRKDSPYQTLADTFDGTVGWTVSHSQSGFNALRHHLLPHRPTDRTSVYRRSVGNLVTARKILNSVLDGTIDIGPLDAYWHMLIRKYNPALTEGVRVLQSTDTAPMPPFVAGRDLPSEHVADLQTAFQDAHTKPWFPAIQDALLIEKFEPATRELYNVTMDWDRDAKAAGYNEPA